MGTETGMTDDCNHEPTLQSGVIKFGAGQALLSRMLRYIGADYSKRAEVR